MSKCVQIRSQARPTYRTFTTVGVRSETVPHVLEKGSPLLGRSTLSSLLATFTHSLMSWTVRYSLL